MMDRISESVPEVRLPIQQAATKDQETNCTMTESGELWVPGKVLCSQKWSINGVILQASINCPFGVHC